MSTPCNTRRSAGLFAAALVCCLVQACTVAKPVTCALTFPIEKFGAALESDEEDDAYRKLPAAVVIAAAPVLIPLSYVYFTAYGAVGGLFSGFVSDLNVLTGQASVDTTFDTLTLPLRTNALPPAER